MMEEDEEVLFDQAGLLTNHIKPVPNIPADVSRGKIFKTFCLCVAFFGLGLCIAIPGPTLLDLQARLQTDTETMSSIFTGRSVGYLIGSILGGFLFDRINQDCLLSFALLLTAVGTALAPWSKSITLLIVLFAFQGVSMGFLDTGGNVACLEIWGRKSAPYMQALHFAFGLGAFVAPLIAEPFLSPQGFNLTNITKVSSTKSALPADDTGRHERYIGNLEGLQEVNENLEVYPVFAPMHGKRKSKHLKRSPFSDSDEEQLTSSESPTQVTPPPKGKKKKPLTNASHLSQEKSVADGTKSDKELRKNKQKEKISKATLAVKTTTPKDVQCDNKSLNNGEKNMCVNASVKVINMSTTTVKTTTTTIVKIESDVNQLTETNDLPTKPFQTVLDSTDNETSSIKNKVNKLLNNVSQVINNLTNVQFAYITISAFLFLVSIMFMCVCCFSSRSLRAIRSAELQGEYIIHKESKGFRIQILILLFLFYFLYVGMEVTYGGLIMTFAVKYLDWSKPKAAYLTSVFWGSFAAGRGLAIPVSRCISPVLMLISDLVLTCLSLAGLVLVMETNHTMLWFCTVTIGIGMSSIFPTGITWAERYMHITGKATAVFVVGSSLGEMALPAFTGFMFQSKSPMWLIYIMLASGLLSAVLYIIMQNLASNKGERYERLNSLLTLMSDETEEMELEMDSVSSSASNHNHNHNIPTAGNSYNRKKVTFKLPGESPSRSPKGVVIKGFKNGPLPQNKLTQ